MTKTAIKPIAKRVGIKDLVVYPEVQRPAPSRKSVQDIIDDFDESSLATIHVNVRKDGTYSLVDGQRRVMALRFMGHENYRCNAMVYQGLTVAQEARLFRKLNKSRQVSAYDQFDKGVTERDSKCLGIDTIVRLHGWTPARTGVAVGAVHCVHVLSKVWDMDQSGKLLDRTVGLLTRIFGITTNTLAASLVEGMALFLSANDDIDETILVSKINACFTGPNPIVTQARSRREMERGSLANNVAAILSKTYKSRKRSIR